MRACMHVCRTSCDYHVTYCCSVVKVQLPAQEMVYVAVSFPVVYVSKLILKISLSLYGTQEGIAGCVLFCYQVNYFIL